MLFRNHSLRRPIVFLLGLGCCAFGLAAVAGFQLSRTAAPAFHGTPYPDTPPAPGFQLTDHRGAIASLDDFRGRPILLFFGFTDCPDFCPLTLAKLSRIVESADGPVADAAILLVTVDPETDTPPRLAEYVGRFGESVTGLTGSPEDLTAVYAAYGVYAERTDGVHGAAPIAHTPVVFGIDRAGRLQVIIHPEDREEIVVDDIRALSEIAA